jgi:hypothetical protein
MVKGEFMRKLGSLRFEFMLKFGTPPNTILVPQSMVEKFVTGFTVDTDAEVDPNLVIDGLKKNEGWLVIHEMVVRLSKTADDVTVCISDEGFHAEA